MLTLAGNKKENTESNDPICVPDQNELMLNQLPITY
jgi:hypothetical protein